MTNIANTNTSIFLVNFDADTRCALQRVLAADVLNVTAYPSAGDFLANFKLTYPCCLIINMPSPDVASEHLLRQLQAWKLSIPTISVTACADVPAALRALRLGALDVCPRPLDAQALLALIHHALAVGAADERHRQQVEAARERLAGLTSRQRELFDLVVQGQTHKEMGVTLGISPRTIEHHRAHMARKLGMDRMADMVRLDITAADGSPAPLQARESQWFSKLPIDQ